MAKETSGWEHIYRQSPAHQDRKIPHEDVESLHRLFHKNGARRVLDLGCGNGRHLVYFASLGYGMYGLDYAPTALRLAGKWLAERRLSAEMACADMTAIPFRSGSFDAVISFQVINHGTLDDIRRTTGEIHRILRDDGWLFVMVGGCRPPGPLHFRNGHEIEPGTYLLTDHLESGIPHHFFTTTELLDNYSRFKFIDLHWDSRSRACLLAQKRD
ncbi:MAG TPA: class I SAM-dependent methyltransferase [Dehalococcoidales bacterium]|nr:class I SAM-dependent methyltransferase [Dehalococcoidales bacterium]